MARPRQPINVVLMNGRKHLTRAEIEERQNSEVKAMADNIQPPSYFNKKQKAEFQKIADELLRIELMTNLDEDALARFILAREQYVKLSKLLRSIHPLEQMDEYTQMLSNVDKLFKQCRIAASDLGLTISSRVKLVVPRKTDDRPLSTEEQMFGDAL